MNKEETAKPAPQAATWKYTLPIVLIIAIVIYIYFFSGMFSTISTGGAPTCNPPYLLVRTGCCLDQNNNNICDSDEITNADQTPNNQSTGGAWSKTSGYTVDECVEVCNGFDMAANVNDCANYCTHNLAKPSDSLDIFVNHNKKELSQPTHG